MSKLQDMLTGKIPYSRTNMNDVMKETANIYSSTKPDVLFDGWFFGTLDAGSYIAPLRSDVEFTTIPEKAGDKEYKDFIEKMKYYIDSESMAKIEFVRIDGALYYVGSQGKFIPQTVKKGK